MRRIKHLCLCIVILCSAPMFLSADEGDVVEKQPKEQCEFWEFPHTFLEMYRDSSACRKKFANSRTAESADGSLYMLFRSNRCSCGNAEKCTAKIVWHKDPVKIPENYIVWMKKKEFTDITGRKPEKILPGSITEGVERIGIDYFVHNHCKAGRSCSAAQKKGRMILTRMLCKNCPLKVDSTGKRELYITRHGVIVRDRKKQRWAWVFVSNIPKLRWRSIDGAKFTESGQILIRQRCALAVKNVEILVSIEKNTITLQTGGKGGHSGQKN